MVNLKYPRVSWSIFLFALLLLFSKLQIAHAADVESSVRVEVDQTDLQTSNLPNLLFGSSDSYVKLYGQINKGFLSYDDGQSTRGYIPVDNASSSTRFGIRSFHRLEEGLSIGSNLEGGWSLYSTGILSQTTKHDINWDSALQLRKAEVYIDSDIYGRLWLGQGSMASDGTAEMDLSGTGLVGYSSVADIAAGQLYRMNSGILSSTIVGGTFKNFDGRGRKFRIRYDTPDLGGFMFGVSIGQQVVPIQTEVTVWDVAAKYSKVHGDINLSGGLSYYDAGGNTHGIDGSVSSLHIPSGISLTIAGAVQSQSGRDGTYFYTKIGHQADYFGFGTTALSVDAYFGKNIKRVASESVSFGIQAVQSIDSWGTELYLGIRSYDYNDTVGDYKMGLAVLVGSRIKF